MNNTHIFINIIILVCKIPKYSIVIHGRHPLSSLGDQTDGCTGLSDYEFILCISLNGFIIIVIIICPGVVRVMLHERGKALRTRTIPRSGLQSQGLPPQPPLTSLRISCDENQRNVARCGKLEVTLSGRKSGSVKTEEYSLDLEDGGTA
jgi:hypothetical protein